MGSWNVRRILPILVAILASLYGAYRLYDIWNFSRNAHETQGLIVARTNSRFTIQYTVEGQVYQIEEELPGMKGPVIETRMRLQPETYVTVLYDAVSPSNARWKNTDNWVFPGALCVIGVAFCLATYRASLGPRRR